MRRPWFETAQTRLLTMRKTYHYSLISRSRRHGVRFGRIVRGDIDRPIGRYLRDPVEHGLMKDSAVGNRPGFAERQIEAEKAFAPRPLPPLLPLRQHLENPPETGEGIVQGRGRARGDVDVVAARFR